MAGRARQRIDAAYGAARDFEELYRESYPVVYNYVRFRVGENAAEDVVAEAFLRAARSFLSYNQDRAKFSTWVIAIAKNCLADYYRREKPTANLEAVPETALSVEGGQDAVRDKMLVDMLLDCLDACERELVVMKYRNGLRNVDIARTMGMNESTVSTRLARALSKMRSAAALR